MELVLASNLVHHHVPVFWCMVFSLAWHLGPSQITPWVRKEAGDETRTNQIISVDHSFHGISR